MAKREANEVANAMHEAKGFNIIASKSSKLLPLASKSNNEIGRSKATVRLKHGKNVSQQVGGATLKADKLRIND